MSKFVFGKTSAEQLEHVHPLLKEVAYKALEISEQDFGVPEGGGLRTAEQQKKSFDEGYSKCDGVIKKSFHQTGRAVDLVPYINGKYDWSSKKAFQDIHVAVTKAWSDINNEEFDIIWGGDWSGAWDKPHYELKKKLNT